jgi:glycosyltransferase involved in cell wall biosynthesis
MLKQVLHVGCGPKRATKLHATFRSPEWSELRLDLDPDVKPDVVASITDMSVVKSETMDAVWSSHNLEHLYPHEVPVALREFWRVIKPGGFALVTLPDLRQVARLIADDKLDDEAYSSPAGPIAPLDILYGHRPQLAHGNLFMAHRTGFTAKTLEMALRAAGFQDVEVTADKHFNLWATAHKLRRRKPAGKTAARVLFIHQNFPGQFLHIATHWAGRPENQVISIGQKHAQGVKGIAKINCDPARATTRGIHHYIAGAEAGVLAGQSVLRTLMQLKKDGFRPDVVIGHAGWGETLYVKDIFPETPLINFFEFFYRATGADTGFDPEYPNEIDDLMRIRTKNVVNLLSLDGCDAGISPTEWQRSGFPQVYRPRISVIHEGVNTDLARPDPAARLKLPDGTVLGPDDEVVTYVSRNLEPYRGFHIFMRAVQEICRRRPRCHIVVIGGDGVSYGRSLPEGQTYRQKMLAEVQIDPKRVHFLGQVPYATYLSALQVSTAHVYLTVPFVLSWSMLEAMAAGCLVIGSDTAPVREALQHEKTGLLVDFFSPQAIADAVDHAIDRRKALRDIRQAARAHVIEHYNYQLGLKNYEDLVRKVAGKRIAGA